MKRNSIRSTRRNGIVALVCASLLAVAFGVANGKQTQHQATVPPAAASVLQTTPPPSIFDNDHRIDTCALLPLHVVNAIAPDLPVNAAHLLPIGNKPEDTSDYEDNCTYNMETATKTGSSTIHWASFTVMGYGPRDTISGGFTTWVNGAMTENAKSTNGHLSKVTMFHAANGKIFDQQAETTWVDPNNKSHLDAIDLLFVYNNGRTSYLIEASSGTGLSSMSIQNLISVATGQLPDLTVTDKNVGRNDLQI